MRIAYLLALLFISVIGFAQAPQRLSFQAVVRNSDNSFVSNKLISVKISVLKGNKNGTTVYVETHKPSTNNNGLISLLIGGGTVQSGDFSSIDWSNDSYFLKREIDPTGGTNYTISGTSQVLSVPYSLHAETANKITGIFTWEYPEGLSTEFVRFSTGTSESGAYNLPYIVPKGKNLYLSGQRYPMVNGIPYGTDGSGIIFSEDTKIDSFWTGGETISYGSSGFLVDITSKITPVRFTLNDTNKFYTVPSGKVLVLKSGTGQGSPLCIENAQYNNSKGFWFIPEEVTIRNCNFSTLDFGYDVPFDGFGYSGYLIDKDK